MSTWSDALAAQREREEVAVDDAAFIRELEKRSMSTWSDEEMIWYSVLTGQANSDIPCVCGDQNCAEDFNP